MISKCFFLLTAVTPPIDEQKGKEGVNFFSRGNFHFYMYVDTY